MKLTKFMLPYPVLGINGAFNDHCDVDNNMTLETTQDNFIFHVKLKIDDETIKSLINETKASFSCEIDCSKTYYREVFFSNKAEFQVQIPRVSLVGSVHLFFSVVAIKQIEKYKNPDFNQRFYEGYSFNLQKGDLLSYLGETSINADIKYNELKAIGSIIEIKKDTKTKYTYSDFSYEKIRIFLPIDEFNNFINSNNKHFADITHASIVQCALVSALYQIKSYKNTLWALTLSTRIKSDEKLKKFENIEDLDDKQISELVSILLDNANKRMFSTIVSLNDNND